MWTSFQGLIATSSQFFGEVADLVLAHRLFPRFSWRVCRPYSPRAEVEIVLRRLLILFSFFLRSVMCRNFRLIFHFFCSRAADGPYGSGFCQVEQDLCALSLVLLSHYGKVVFYGFMIWHCSDRGAGRGFAKTRCHG
jgi:hypothetical protein